MGNGASAATFELACNGLLTFANGFTMAGGPSLRGNGTFKGTLTVAVGGTVSPGNPPSGIGKMVLNTPPALSGSVVMEISNKSGTVTNDQIQVAGTLTYGGSLTISNLGPEALILGNSFPFFSATIYSGALTTLALPPLPAGFAWANQLLVNGLIGLVNKTPPSISGVAPIGTNLLVNVTGGSPGAAWDLPTTTTSVNSPLLDWTTNRSGVFDWFGNVTLTNGLNLTEPQSFFLISAP